jgi:hypothetical protein
LIDDYFARGTRYEIAVPNELGVPISLDSVKISISDRQKLTWAEPNWELLPFFDFLVVKVRNDGWEDFRGTELDLFASPGQFAPDDARGRWDRWPGPDIERVRGILDKQSSPIQFKAPLADKQYFFLKLVADAEPFGFVFDRGAVTPRIPRTRVFLTMASGRDMGHAATTSVPVIHVVEPGEQRVGKPKGDYGQSSLFGSMTPLGGGRIERMFQTTVLQLAAHDDKELYASELTGASLHGGLAPSGVFLFGNAVAAYVPEQVIVRLYGITVDLRGRTGDVDLEFPVGRMIGPQKDERPVDEKPQADAKSDPKIGPMTFDLRFITDRPSEFTVGASMTWHVGSNEPVTHKRKQFRIRTTFPREHDVSWRATKDFVEKLIAADPSVLERCRKFIDDGIPAPKRGTAAELQAFTRKYVDALLVLSVKADGSDGPRLKKASELLYLTADRGDKMRITRHRLAIDALPILSEVGPDAAAAFVRSCLLSKSGTDEDAGREFIDRKRLLAIAMSCRAILPALLTKPDGLADMLDHRRVREYWDPAEFMLACHLGLPAIEQVLGQDGLFDKDRLLGCLALAACTNPDKRTRAFLVGVVQKQLRKENLERPSAASILFSLQVGGGGEFRADVRNLLKRLPRDMSSADVLFAGLRYVQAIGVTSEEKELLRELSKYSYRSEVRDLAKKLLESL